jgi:hypothetical protein
MRVIRSTLRAGKDQGHLQVTPFSRLTSRWLMLRFLEIIVSD